jgi:Rrf2 family transcriptional regulator, cysteine metabolism repressor
LLHLSTKGRYGMRLMLDLALNYGQAPVSLKDISKRQEISEKYLEQIIVPLKRANLIRADRGAHGGYFLVKPPSAISLEEIMTAMEGPLSLVECTVDPSVCKRAEGCLSRGLWIELAGQIRDRLCGLTLENVIRNRHNNEECCHAV